MSHSPKETAAARCRHGERRRRALHRGSTRMHVRSRQCNYAQKQTHLVSAMTACTTTTMRCVRRRNVHCEERMPRMPLHVSDSTLQHDRRLRHRQQFANRNQHKQACKDQATKRCVATDIPGAGAVQLAKPTPQRGKTRSARHRNCRRRSTKCC